MAKEYANLTNFFGQLILNKYKSHGNLTWISWKRFALGTSGSRQDSLARAGLRYFVFVTLRTYGDNHLFLEKCITRIFSKLKLFLAFPSPGTKNSH